MRILDMARRPGAILLVVLLSVAAALYLARGLRIRADLVSLLPEDSPAAEDYRVFVERFGGLEQVFVLVLAGPGATTSDLARAASSLEEALSASPAVRHARAGLEAGDRRFFTRWVAPRAPLLLGDDWRDVVLRRTEPDAIARRVAWLRAALSTPTGAVQAVLAPSDPLGFTEELSLSASPGAFAVEPLTSTFRSADGDAALVLVTPTRGEMDPEGGRVLQDALETAYAEVRQAMEGVELAFHAVGGPLYAAQDELVLRRDLERTLSTSLLLTSALLIVAFGGWRLPLTVVAPLLVGLVWTAAAITWLRGDIAAVSIGFAAILVGLGIDYGIHGGTRFRQACLADPSRGAGAAFRDTLRHVGPPILTSAATTAAGFAVLGMSHLKPLRELGFLVSLGVVTILVAMAVAGGASWVLVAPKLRPPGAAWRALGRIGDLLPDFASRRPRWVLATAAAATLVAVPLAGRLSIDADVRTLRPDDHPTHRAEELLTERFGVGVDTATVVVHGPEPAVALEAAREAAAELRRELPAGAVSSPADLLPLGGPVEDRLRELSTLPLERAAADLERELAASNLNPRAFASGLEALRALGRGEDPGAPPVDAWPDWLRRSIRLDDEGAWIAVHLRLPAGSWPEGPPPKLVDRVRAVAPNAAFASAARIGSELRTWVVEDLRTLALLALALVAATVTISFRGRWRDSGLAVLPVLLGSVWALALWGALGRPLDFFTLAVLPILLGVGIDDGLHVVHGAHSDPEGGIRGSVERSGRALVLTTLTTCVGFGSLLLSSIPGLRNGGALIAVGVFLCLLTTLLVLPALEAVRRPPGRSVP